MNIKDMLNVPAKDSTLFWVFIGVILAVILFIALRELFMRYFGVIDLRSRVEELEEKVERLGRGGMISSGSAAVSNEAEIAAAVAAAIHSSK